MSLAGLAVSLGILLPSFLLLPFPPRAAHAMGTARVGWPLLLLERAGQAGCLVAPTLSGHPPDGVLWLVLLVAAVGVYYGLWVRFFVAGRPFALLYAPLGPVPVPMAVFPVLGFLAAAAWLSSWWAAGAAVALAVGHIGASLSIARTVA